MATYFTDDFADSGTDWTKRWNTTPTWTVSGGDVDIPNGVTNDWSGWTWNDVDGDANRDNVEILAVVTIPGTVGTRSYPFVVRGSGADESAVNYSLAVFPSGTPSSSNIRTYQVNGADSPNLITSYTLTLNASSDYWIRFRVNGSSIQAKMWSGAIGDEPGSWQIDGTDSTHATVGWVGLADYSNVVNNCIVKQLGVGTNGDTAPYQAAAAAASLAMRPVFRHAILNF